MHKYLYLGVGRCYYLYDKLFHARQQPIQAVHRKKLAKLSKRYELYVHDFCPKSISVKRFLKQRHIQIPVKSANRFDIYRKELLRGGGALTTPCLRVRREDGGEERWVYGMKQILAFVDAHIS